MSEQKQQVAATKSSSPKKVERDRAKEAILSQYGQVADGERYCSYPRSDLSCQLCFHNQMCVFVSVLETKRTILKIVSVTAIAADFSHIFPAYFVNHFYFEDLVKNVNSKLVVDREKAEREKDKHQAEQKKQKDREDREKQKQKKEERKESEKKRTQKQERRR